MTCLKQKVSEEVLEIFNEPDFEKTLKLLAVEFTSDATLKNVYDSFQENRKVPVRTINGVEFKAGYHTIQSGTHTATLLEIKKFGQVCKFMFGFTGNKFLYYNYPLDKLRIEDILKLANFLQRTLTVVVSEDIVSGTGDCHMVVSSINCNYHDWPL